MVFIFPSIACAFDNNGYKDLGTKPGSATKVWQIKFNQEVDETSVTPQNIYVKNSNHQTISTVLGREGSIVYINPPKDGYDPGDYTIYVDAGVCSRSHVSLKQKVMMKFCVPVSSNPLDNGYDGDYTIADAGTYGPAAPSATVNGSVCIEAAGVTLQNLVISGDLTFGAGIAEGDAYIDNVTVMGNTIVNGGGSNSIHLQGDSEVGNMVVDDSDSTPRIVNEDASTVASIEVKTPVTIVDNSITTEGVLSNIGYVKADDAGLTTISGTNADGLIQNIIEKAQYFIDDAYQDKNSRIVKDLYASIDMLNDDTIGIHSLKKYLFPLENSDETNIVPADLQASYTQAQDDYLQLWTDWNSTFPLLSIVKNLRDLNQPWITRSGQYALAIAEQQYMLNNCQDKLNSSGAADTHSYTADTTLEGQPINVENVGRSIDILQKELIVNSLRVTDGNNVSKSASGGLAEGDKIIIEFKYGNITNWDAVVNTIGAANSANFTAAAGIDHNTNVNLLGTDFTNVTLKEIILTATKEVSRTPIIIPRYAFNLGAVDTMIGGPISDVKGPAVDAQIPMDY
jgi:hypothetical protein